MTTRGGVEDGMAISSSSLQAERERQSLVVEFNDSAAPYPSEQTIVELFEAQVARTPQDEAIRFGDQFLTYHELNDRANQVAAHLRTLGVGVDQLIVLCMEHSIEAVCAMLGVLKAGAAYVPVDAAIPKGRLAFILRDISEGLGGGLPVLVTQTPLVSNLPTGAARVVILDADFASIGGYPVSNTPSAALPRNLAYVIYTSGSTGTPKGVMIEHRSLVNYIWWANEMYCRGERLTWPLFSSLAFDLTVTSSFTPLISGGRIVVYREDPEMHGTVVLKVVKDNLADIVKLTPAHLAMIKDMNLGATRIRKFIVGGEEFKTELARDITRNFGRPVEIYNEYGPTEATVGCMIHRYDMEKDRTLSVPIGVPAANTGIYILDEDLSPVPPGVIGEMYLAGDGLARGYFNRPELTGQAFLTAEDPRHDAGGPRTSGTEPPSLRLFKTGDIARWSADGRMEFLGRADHQVKVGGARIELGEIEGRLLKHTDVRECVVDVVSTAAAKVSDELRYCTRCGLASNYPGIIYDAGGVCDLCRGFDTYVNKAQAYFKTRDDLKAIVDEVKAARTGEYDCLVLFSGGKDSTYMLYQLCDLGLKPLVFSLDNGFISEEAKANIRRVAELLGVKLVFGNTPHMNEIFVDSLNRFANVCNGCFKTIYTLATNVAHEEGIKYIFTGLSRGQFFETRLTEEVFKRKDFDVAKLDALVLEARKAYHQREDAVSCHLAVDILRGDGVLDDIQFIDFYRYWSVSLEELFDYLKKRGAWVRPSDTGRSTNCLINEVGIYLHKKQRGFHNYSLPYSWDVRLGQKTRSEAMEELEDAIDEAKVKELMAEIGYTEPPPAEETGINRLVAYYVSEKPLPVAELRAHLAQDLPDYMLPTYYVRLDRLPLTSNGKVDRKALPPPTAENRELAHDFVRPQTGTEKALAVIFTELLKLENIGVNDEFFDLGGHSLLAIRAASRIRDVFDVDIPLDVIFAKPTISGLVAAIAEAKGSGGAIRRIERHTQGGPFPLSDAQEQLWFVDQVAPGSPVYNMLDVVHITGRCDSVAMRRALNEMVRRHEILRTGFSHRDGRPMQNVVPTIDMALPELDVSSRSEQEREREWARVVREHGRRSFDFSQAPLLRGALVHVSHEEHRLLLVTHAIIADEWSMEIIHQEVQQLYDAFSQGRPSPLPELPIQFVDFTSWQRNWLQGEVLQKQVSYWKEELAGAQFALELPADKPRPAVPNFLGATQFFQVSEALLDRLKRLGREEHATLFMVLEAAFAVLLHRYTGQDDVLVGTPISGRTSSETENLIGLFSNTIVLRTRFNNGLNFRSLLQQVRERALGAYAHPDLPLEHVVAELAPKRDSNRTPLFQVMFILHNPDGVSQVSQVSGSRELATGTSKIDLSLVLSETENCLDGMLEYSTDLFEAETIRRMSGHFVQLLEAIVGGPDQRIAKLPLISDAERRQVVEQFNATAVATAPATFVARFERQASLTPSACAVRFEGAGLTYGELNQRANQVAHYLRALGVTPGVVVGVCLPRSLEMVVALLGVQKSGGAYVPLDPSFPAVRLGFMLADSGATVLVTADEAAAGVAVPAGVRLVDLGAEAAALAGMSDANGEAGAGRRDPAYVIYTSDSTGRPKGVVVSHGALANFLESMRREPGLSEADVLAAITTIAFDIAGLELYLPLMVGARVELLSRETATDGPALAAQLAACGATVLQATPATWRLLLEAGWAGSPTLRALCGGEALPRDLADALLARTQELWNLYGPTETTIWSTVERIEHDERPITIGRPIANTQVYVLDRHGEPVPVGIPGELWIGGAGVALGYHGRPELMAERFVADRLGRQPGGTLYRTGDLGRWRADGRLEHLGRLDNQVKIRGFRTELGEIEAALSAHPAIRDAVVVARETGPGDRRLIAYVVYQAGEDLTVSDVRRHLRRELPEYMIPSVVVALEAIPLTPSRKVDRAALPDPYKGAGKLGTDYEPPAPGMEQLLADIWREVLQVDRIGADDNFFELGGYSLRSLRAAAAVEKRTGWRMDPRMLFFQTLRQIAAGASEYVKAGVSGADR